MGFGQGACSQFKVRRNQVNQRNIYHIQQRYPELQSPNGLHLLFILFYLLPLYLLSSKRDFISSVLRLREFFFQLRFRNIDYPIFWICMTTNLCAYLLTQTPECTWFYNATPDEQWKAKTFADEQQITLFGPVSIEKICLVEGQVKDTSPVSITTVTFKNQGTQRALYLYKVPNFMPLSMWESATQNRYHAESNPTQLNSMELSLNEVTGDTRGARVWNLCQ